MALDTDEIIGAKFHNNVLVPCARLRKFLKEQNHIGDGELRSIVIECATALFHFREHLPTAQCLTRKYYEEYCPDYGLLGDIANASKHHEISKNNPQVVSSEDIYEVLVITEYVDESGLYTDCMSCVHANLVDGTIRDVVDAVRNVLNMWKLKLVEMGIDSIYMPSKSLYVPPVSKQDSRNPNLRLTKGIANQLNMKFMKYDYESNTVVGKELPGADKVILKMWRNPELTVSLGSESIRVEVPLDTYEFDRFKTLNKQAATDFLREIATRDGIVDSAIHELQEKVFGRQLCWSIYCT